MWSRRCPRTPVSRRPEPPPRYAIAVPDGNKQTECSATTKAVGVKRVQDEQDEDRDGQALESELEPDCQQQDHGSPTQWRPAGPPQDECQGTEQECLQVNRVAQKAVRLVAVVKGQTWCSGRSGRPGRPRSSALPRAPTSSPAISNRRSFGPQARPRSRRHPRRRARTTNPCPTGRARKIRCSATARPVPTRALQRETPLRLLPANAAVRPRPQDGPRGRCPHAAKSSSTANFGVKVSEFTFGEKARQRAAAPMAANTPRPVTPTKRS